MSDGVDIAQALRDALTEIHESARQLPDAICDVPDDSADRGASTD